LASSAGKDKISKRIYKKNFTIIEEKKKARRRRAAPRLARLPIRLRHAKA
jgi:hypothetical protein